MLMGAFRYRVPWAPPLRKLILCRDLAILLDLCTLRRGNASTFLSLTSVSSVRQGPLFIEPSKLKCSFRSMRNDCAKHPSSRDRACESVSYILHMKRAPQALDHIIIINTAKAGFSLSGAFVPCPAAVIGQLLSAPGLLGRFVGSVVGRVPASCRERLSSQSLHFQWHYPSALHPGLGGGCRWASS